MPMPKTGKDLSDEEKADAVQCEGIETRRAEVTAALVKLAPVADTTGGDEEIVLEDDGAPAEADAAKKSGGSSSGGSKSSGGNRTLCKMGFRKQCR